MVEKTPSIFEKYYSPEPFEDRYERDKTSAVDIIIPLIHANELWEKNLISFYREIPIHCLIIGNGGCLDPSILDVVKKFPRVKILDHTKYKSQGYSLRKMIEEVDTAWFVYPHSDVYLPPGWFDTMAKHQSEYDWFGCPMQHTVMVEYPIVHEERPMFGSQMGRKAAFKKELSRIDDDYVRRQEEFVLADVVKRAGFKNGRVYDTFHYHQTMHKPSPLGRKVKSVSVELEMPREEKVKTWIEQGRGIVKYLEPNDPWAIRELAFSVEILHDLGELDWSEFKNWVHQTNPQWMPYLRAARRRLYIKKARTFLKKTFERIFGHLN